MSEVKDRYRDAINAGDAASLAAWAATGADGVRLLRRELEHTRIRADRSVHPRDAIDNLSEMVAAIAEAAPHPFLTEFMHPRWAHEGFVLVGLGKIDDPEATRRLIIGLGARGSTTRIDAAIGLGRREDPRATHALVEALDDEEYLVRYHALESLTAIGDETALRALGRPAWPTAIEADLARTARDAIEARRPAR